MMNEKNNPPVALEVHYDRDQYNEIADIIMNSLKLSLKFSEVKFRRSFSNSRNFISILVPVGG